MMNNTYYKTLDAKLSQKVAAKLGVKDSDVHVTEWITRNNGIQVPIFAVPPTHINQAKNLGLSLQ